MMMGGKLRTPPRRFWRPRRREHCRSRPSGPASMSFDPATDTHPAGRGGAARDEHPVTKDGSNARKKAARELAAAEQITYTEALRQIDRRSAYTSPSPSGAQRSAAGGASQLTTWVGPPVATLTTDVVLLGHTSVNSVSFHPDGHILASGGDATARLWDLATRQTITVLTTESSVSSVTFSPVGGTLAVAIAHRDGTVTLSLWDIATGQITSLTPSGSRILSVAFSPDGRTLATSEIDRAKTFDPHEGSISTVRIWDLASGQATAVSSRERTYGGKALAFHPGGRILASSPGMDGSIQLLDVVSGQATIVAGQGPIEAAAFSPDGGTLATCSTDGTIRLRDLATGQTAATLTHGGYVVSVAFSPDGGTLASSSTDRTARLWDPVTGRATATLFGHTEIVWSAAFSPDGHTLATGSMDGTVRLWPLSDSR
jgi:WD40 repeat protein